ncbi:MAG: molybdopterin-dependent oxidoreductase [Gammaproteobacteria bacterium]
MHARAAAMSARVERSYCRICSGLCGMQVTIENDRIAAVRGDRAHPLSRGFACIKGLQAAEAHHGPRRLLHPLRRRADGSFERVALPTALDEIAARLDAILRRDGPGALAAYRGTINVYSAASSQMLADWLRSLGSDAYYTTMSIDQSAKWVTFERLGGWMAPRHSIDGADVMLLAGNNPLVSVSGPGLAHDPVRTLAAARARGMKLIVIDPRRTETARHADLFLQPVPGQDAVLAAGLLNLILAEGWHDRPFCARFVDGLEALQAAVSAFTPALVEARSGVPAAQLQAAARMFAHGDGSRRLRGPAHAGTGVTMGPHCNLADHLYECLNVICGRYLRAGEPVANPGLMTPPGMPVREGVWPPARSWERGWKSRIGGYGMLFGERMTAELADEILTPGPGRIRALFVDGGNPVPTIPDRERVAAAFADLELLVTIDPFMTETARLSHYVLPPTAFYEHADLLCAKLYETAIFARPVAQYTPALMPPPAGSDVADDCAMLWGIAQRLGRTVRFDGVDLDMRRPPSMDDLHAILMRNGRVSFQAVRARRGEIVDLPPVFVEAAADGGGRFAVAPEDVRAELAQIAAAPPAVHVGFTHLLVSRRMREVSNTMYRDFAAIRRRVPVNPARMHPADLSALGLRDGDRITLVSAHGRTGAVVAGDDTLRPGVVSLSHGWGGLPGDAGAAGEGAVTALVSSTRELAPINAMPRQSAIPIRVEREAR